MSDVTRRDFIKLGMQLATIMGLSSTAFPQIGEALAQIASKTSPVIWLQGLSCSGCSVSFLNSENPGPVEIITRYISLLFHSTLSTATGSSSFDIISKAEQSGGILLAVEGGIPRGMPDACRMGEKRLAEHVVEVAKKAKAVVAVGTCACFGGIPAAENNPTGATSVPALLKAENIHTPVISVPGCPVHPDWLIGTLVHVLKFGIPSLDEKGRPQMFYSKLVHEQCPKFTDYEGERFATSFSEDGCLFRLGCAGPLTHADCTVRQWNSGTNSCIRAGSPCIGCASEHFAAKSDYAFFPRDLSLKTS